MANKERRELQQEELDEQRAMAMPDREEMSIIQTPGAAPPVIGSDPSLTPPPHPIGDPHGPPITSGQ